jgi:4-amino-4-deoxy-L-arabinose transferase-like glycosyltransferase
MAWFVVLLVFLAFVLRIAHLGDQSFWYDEGQSHYFAHQDSLGAMLDVISDSDHPPLYFILLYLWMSIAGRSEFALRFTALFWSVLLVPLIYLLGRRALGTGEGRVAALLMAISPFHVWYAQEARMYTLATFLGLLSSYLLLLALQKGRRSLWLAYTLAALAAPYAHLYACFVLLFQSLFVLLWAWRSRPKVPFLRAWLLSQVSIGLGFLPWVGVVLREYASNATYWPGILDLKRFLLDTVVAFSAGLTLPPGQAGWTATAFLLALGVGCASLAFRRSEPRPRWQGFSLVLLYLMVPTLAALLISYRHPKYAPRYLLLVTPAYYLLAARGLATLRAHRRWAGLAVLLFTVILVGTVQSLYNGYLKEEYARDDFRAVLSYIEANAWQDDAVIIVGGHAYPILDYYNRLGLAAYPIPPRLVASVKQPVDRRLVAETLNEIVAHHRRVWLILWQERLGDPARLVLNELVANTLRLGVGAKFHGPALLLFSLEDKPHFSVEPPVQHPIAVDFADNMQLVGYELTKGQWLRDKQQRELAAAQAETEELVFEPGETVYLALYWRTRGAVEGDYTAFTHLLAQDGTLYGSWDRKLGGEFYPSSQWPTGDTLREEYPLVVSPEAPPGRYQIEVGLYLPMTMERLPVLDENGQPVETRILLGEVQVE